MKSARTTLRLSLNLVKGYLQLRLILHDTDRETRFFSAKSKMKIHFQIDQGEVKWLYAVTYKFFRGWVEVKMSLPASLILFVKGGAK